jgi:hypothetical protein
MEMLAFLLAFIPAGIIFGFRAYLKAHPPDSSAVGIRRLYLGLKLGTISAAALPLSWGLLVLSRPVRLGNILDVLCALTGNILNFVGLIYCLRVLSGESLVSAFLLIFIQLLWIAALSVSVVFAN